MEIRLTRHARVRTVSRGIDHEMIERACRDPDRVRSRTIDSGA